MSLFEKEEQLLKYIERYVQTAKECCAFLSVASGCDITRAYDNYGWQGVIPQVGKVNGVSYAFHGRGCFFKRKGLVLDVDFDTIGGCNAFDEWRIRFFLENNYPQETYWTSPTIADSLSRLVQQQLLHQVAREYDEHFYYLGAAPAIENRS